MSQVCKNLPQRLSVVLHELRCAELPGYQSSLMGLVNCLILANENLQDRVRIRNEFIGGRTLQTVHNILKDDCDLSFGKRHEFQCAERCFNGVCCLVLIASSNEVNFIRSQSARRPGVSESPHDGRAAARSAPGLPRAGPEGRAAGVAPRGRSRPQLAEGRVPGAAAPPCRVPARRAPSQHPARAPAARLHRPALVRQ